MNKFAKSKVFRPSERIEMEEEEAELQHFYVKDNFTASEYFSSVNSTCIELLWIRISLPHLLAYSHWSKTLPVVNIHVW